MHVFSWHVVCRLRACSELLSTFDLSTYFSALSARSMATRLKQPCSARASSQWCATSTNTLLPVTVLASRPRLLRLDWYALTKLKEQWYFWVWKRSDHESSQLMEPVAFSGKDLVDYQRSCEWSSVMIRFRVPVICPRSGSSPCHLDRLYRIRTLSHAIAPVDWNISWLSHSGKSHSNQPTCECWPPRTAKASKNQKKGLLQSRTLHLAGIRNASDCTTVNQYAKAICPVQHMPEEPSQQM